MKRKFSDEFKLWVVKDYYSSPLGLRAVALKHNLPSKNYITNWEGFLKKKGLLPIDATKPNKAVGRSAESVMRNNNKTQRERQYEAEIEQLKARIEYFESLDYMQPFIKKNKNSER